MPSFFNSSIKAGPDRIDMRNSMGPAGVKKARARSARSWLARSGGKPIFKAPALPVASNPMLLSNTCIDWSRGPAWARTCTPAAVGSTPWPMRLKIGKP